MPPKIDLAKPEVVFLEQIASEIGGLIGKLIRA
jgi:hypothetical protein